MKSSSLQLDDVAEKVQQSLFAWGGRQQGNEIVFSCISGAHADHHPSSKYNIIKRCYHCFSCGAGGGLSDLAKRLGLIEGKTRIKFSPCKPRFDWRKFANAVEHLSDTMYLRSERIFSAGYGLTPSQWTDSELDAAMRVIAKAFYYREQSERLADFAVAYRAKHLTEEQSNARRRSKAA